jgi:photosynthetic reaction center H subunit
MQFPLITQHIDWALVVLYAFWLFFAGLVFYLLREGRREGYPLVDDLTGKAEKGGLVWIPAPKTFLTAKGEVFTAPRQRDEPEIRAVPSAPFPGSPLVPVGNPFTAGVGPGAYALRSDRPDVMADGETKILPMRLLHEHEIAEDDADPRGMEMVGADGLTAGIVADLWIDRSEMMVRYLEVRLDPAIAASRGAMTETFLVESAAVAVDRDTGDAAVAVVDEIVTVPASGARDTVLIPFTAATVAAMYGQVATSSVLARQFADVPRTRDPNAVTLLEEEKIGAYFSAGELYATPARSEPML